MARRGQTGLMVALVALGIALGGGSVYLLVSRRTPPPSPAPAPVIATPAPAETSPPMAEPSAAADPEPGPEIAARPPADAPARPIPPPERGKGTVAAPPRTVTKVPAPAVATRSFNPGVASASGPLVKGDLQGFTGAKSDIHRGARVPGALEFEADPVAPVPGQPYAVRIFLQNQGRKTIKLLSVEVTAIQDGVPLGGVVPLPVKEIKAGQRVLVAERLETWPPRPPRTFELQAMVKSKDDDTYSRTLVLK